MSIEHPLPTRIVLGEFDSDLDLIQNAIVMRKQLLGIVNPTPVAPNTVKSKNDFSVGDRVRFTARVRPQYMAGATATVTGFKTKNLLIKLDAPSGRFGASIPFKCPPSILEKV